MPLFHLTIGPLFTQIISRLASLPTLHLCSPCLTWDGGGITANHSPLLYLALSRLIYLTPGRPPFVSGQRLFLLQGLSFLSSAVYTLSRCTNFFCNSYVKFNLT
jgi:hypothetical protein